MSALFAYEPNRRLVVFLDPNGNPYGGASLAQIQAVDPTATHEKFMTCLPRIGAPEPPRIVQAGAIPRGIDGRLRRR